ncbi:MAG TPA: hypothetical protein VJU78_11690, partial [Chitinophagaceae bacterium]|nr:hypothetical protein [Chitinophagaceae bacterium]
MSNNRVIYRPVIIFIFYCFAAVSHLSAQEKSTWTLNHILNADNGLPQNSITDLYFDHITGFLWIATEGGLANYNGISTKIFDSRNVSGFRTSRIMQFTRTVDNKIIAIDKSAIGVPISGNSVKTRGGVDYSFYNNGNFSFQRMPPLKDTNFLARLKTISEKIGKPVSIATSLISCIDDSTTLVFRQEGSAHIVRKAAFNLPVYLPYAYTLLNIKPGNNVAALDSTGNGYFIDVSRKKVVPVKSANPDLFKGGYAIYPDNINDRHYLLKGKKLYEFQISNTTIELKPLADLPELPQSNIMHISVHPNNNQVYFGTLYHGVYIYTRSFISTYQLNDIKKYTGENRYSSLPLVSNFLASVLIDSNQTLVGFRSGGEWGQTALLNLKDSTFDFILKSNWPSTYAIDRQKNVYVQFKGLTRYSFDLYKKTTFHTYKVSTTAFYYDSKYDRVWVADNQKGIFGFLKGDSMQEYFRYSLSLAPNLAVIKRTNKMLIAFNENAFLRVDEVNKKFEQLYFFDKPCLRDVYIDEDSLAWLSTYGQGLYMYNLKTGKIYHPKPDSKMYLLFAHCVADDGRGNFFIPTNNGLFHINRKALITACMDSTQTVFYHYYDKTRGLLQNEFNGGCQPSYNRMYNGDLLFPSMHGLVRLHSTSVSEPDKYPLFIQKITSPYKTYHFSNDLVFDVKERVLTWEVNFAQWEHPDASGLSYQLDNDKTWKYLDADERNIRLAGLEGGSHTLRIRNQFDLAGNKISMLNIDFYVEKKYHEKAWFWILLTVFLFAVIYMAAALRNLQLKRQNIQLERTIHSKTLEVK